MIGEARNNMQEDKELDNLPVYDCEEFVKVSDSMQGSKMISHRLKKVANNTEVDILPSDSERNKSVRAALAAYVEKVLG